MLGTGGRQSLHKPPLSNNLKPNHIQDGPSTERKIRNDHDSAYLEQRSVKSSGKVRKPLVYIDVDIGDEQKERIEVYRGDDARYLADQFC